MAYEYLWHINIYGIYGKSSFLDLRRPEIVGVLVWSMSKEREYCWSMSSFSIIGCFKSSLMNIQDVL